MLLVKRWLLKIIVILSKRYPEPVDIWHPNARILFRTLNKYLEYEQNNGRKILIEAVLRILLDEYQRHTFYRYRFDWFIDEIKDEWLPRSAKPMSLWSEPRQAYEGTFYPVEALSEIMKAAEPQHSELIQNFILSASEERIFRDSCSDKQGV